MGPPPGCRKLTCSCNFAQLPASFEPPPLPLRLPAANPPEECDDGTFNCHQDADFVFDFGALAPPQAVHAMHATLVCTVLRIPQPAQAGPLCPDRPNRRQPPRPPCFLPCLPTSRDHAQGRSELLRQPGELCPRCLVRQWWQAAPGSEQARPDGAPLLCGKGGSTVLPVPRRPSLPARPPTHLCLPARLSLLPRASSTHVRRSPSLWPPLDIRQTSWVSARAGLVGTAPDSLRCYHTFVGQAGLGQAFGRPRGIVVVVVLYCFGQMLFFKTAPALLPC